MKVCKDEFPESEGFTIDGFTYKNLKIVHRAVTKKNHDAMFVTDGYEGFGKSCLTQQLCHLLSRGFKTKRRFTNDNIVFTPKKFIDKVLTARKFSCVMWDEARSGANVRRSMSSINNTITDMLAEIRQRNLFVFFVLPTFMDMDSNIAVWRTRALFHITPRGFRRGFYSFFSGEKKRKLYFYGKQRKYDYSVQTPNFRAKFPNFWCIDEEEYKKKKALALRAYNKDDQNEETIKVPATLTCPACKTRKVFFNTETKILKCSLCGYIVKKVSENPNQDGNKDSCIVPITDIILPPNLTKKTKKFIYK